MMLSAHNAHARVVDGRVVCDPPRKKVAIDVVIPKLRCSGVYALIHNPSGRSYIGSTINIRSRCRDHVYRLHAGTHKALKLQKAWDASVASDVTCRVLEICERTLLQEREQAWVNATPCLLNTTRHVRCPSQDPLVAAKIRAASSSIGPEVRAVQSRIRTEAWQRREYRDRMLAATRTAHQNPETKALHQEANRHTWKNSDVRARRIAGIKAATTPELRRLRSESATRQWADPDQRAIKVAAIKAKAHVMSQASLAAWRTPTYRNSMAGRRRRATVEI